MKTVPLAPLVLLLLTTSVIAQIKTETSDPPDVSVLEKSWSKKARYWDPKKQYPNPRTPNEELMKQARAEKGVSGNLKDSATGAPPIAVESPQPLFLTMRQYTSYVYKIKAKNNGLKTIKALYWEYQFLDPDTQRVLGTHPMASSKKLSPGETGVFKAETAQPPVAFVSENQFDKKFGLKFIEQLVIYRVDYTDGSVWQRP